MKVKISGMKAEHLGLDRIGRRRVQLGLNPLRDAHQDRPDADGQEGRNEGRHAEGQKAEQVEDRRRIGRRQIVDPAIERRLTHFDGDEEHLVEREEHRNWIEHAAGSR